MVEMRVGAACIHRIPGKKTLLNCRNLTWSAGDTTSNALEEKKITEKGVYVLYEIKVVNFETNTKGEEKKNSCNMFA